MSSAKQSDCDEQGKAKCSHMGHIASLSFEQTYALSRAEQFCGYLADKDHGGHMGL
jgi:hypothetical protein